MLRRAHANIDSLGLTSTHLRVDDQDALLRESAEQRAALARPQGQLDRVLAQLELQTAPNAKLNDRTAVR